ncbi:hypothetical protein BIW11_02194 [Tropilaelaps mercedesae]|uniref:Uncharacterized protein n=1 Tax=Tropilaelaps mercedesae TaxID=418985 RepID=A0A1V9X1J1_9ACAR|nr:hypothetical protein BIW11_02194 [Tropilaelaps mercedesae]
MPAGNICPVQHPRGSRGVVHCMQSRVDTHGD